MAALEKLRLVLEVNLELAVATPCRFFIMSRGGLTRLLAWPLIAAEMAYIQLMADRYEKRLFSPTLTRSLISNALGVAVIEGLGLALATHGPVLTSGFGLLPIVDAAVVFDGAAARATIWRVPLFELGVDLAFYTFHRCCHSIPWLYAAVHKKHHAETAKAHGRLVAYETYTLTWLETLTFLGNYLLGFLLLRLIGPVGIGEAALLVSYCHTVELSGHTALTWTPPTPWRVLPYLLGIELNPADHTLHHDRMNKNYSKRFKLWDQLGQTYASPK
jgi:sterol desaturase/sphingolipid hydroxylase (fatty acid hydroxylase superfamily)